MDAGRILIGSVGALALAGCATSARSPEPPQAAITSPPASVAETRPTPVEAIPVATAPVPAAVHNPGPSRLAANPKPIPRRSKLVARRVAVVPTRPHKLPGPSGRAAIAAANARALAASRADRFVNGMQMFPYEPGRVYEVWTAPYRVTTLSLAPGETVTSKAAGDTVRWQIGETTSGSGAQQRSDIMIKPLKAGLATNLVLTTSERVYMLTLRSAEGDAYNVAVGWDYPKPPTALAAAAPAQPPPPVQPPPHVEARYRIEAKGARPRWTPASVFDDGVRTYIVFGPELQTGDAPVLFVLADGEAQVVNYRQSGAVLIVDRLFERAELRFGDKHPQVVRITRAPIQRAAL